MMKIRLAWLVLAACPLLSYAADNNFQKGKEAYEAQNYQQALEYFNMAWGDGSNDASLAYNRAVCFYKLGQLESAKKTFSSLLVNTKWIHLARYNLARISEQQGRYEKAYIWYNKVASRANNPRLQRIAGERLIAIQKHLDIAKDPRDKEIKRNAGLLSVGYVVDSNATGLAEELVSKANDVSDTYLRLFAYAHHYLEGEQRDGVKIYGIAQVRRFQKFDSHDTSIFGGGIDYEKNLFNIDVSVGSSFNSISTSTGLLANQLSFKTKLAKSSIMGGRLQARYQGSYFSAGEEYNHLDGRQHKFTLAWQRALSRFLISPSLSWEGNNRRDILIQASDERELQYFSYSPNILGLQTKLQWKLNDYWRFYGDLTYKSATFRSVNIHKDIATEEKEQIRDATRLAYTLGVLYKMNDNWQVKGEYLSISNTDAFQLYSYDKNIVNVSLNLLW